MEYTENVNVRISSKQFERLRALAQANGIKVSVLVRLAIKKYLDEYSGETVDPMLAGIKDLKAEIDRLNAKINALEEKIDKISEALWLSS